MKSASCYQLKKARERQKRKRRGNETLITVTVQVLKLLIYNIERMYLQLLAINYAIYA